MITNGRYAYDPDCDCKKCSKETARREKQAQSSHTHRRAHLKQGYRPRKASREEQHARYLDCGPQNWDDR